MNDKLTRLKHLRGLVLVVVLAGIGASIAMNVLHAPDSLPARFVAALPPVAVFGCLELITRIPSSSKALTVVRVLGAATVAGGAAFLSFAQQRAAVESLGFPEWQSWMWPWIIDGTMVVASVSLVEVIKVIRRIEDRHERHVQVEAAAAPLVEQVEQAMAESPEAIAFRAAQRPLRSASALSALNAKV